MIHVIMFKIKINNTYNIYKINNVQNNVISKIIMLYNNNLIIVIINAIGIYKTLLNTVQYIVLKIIHINFIIKKAFKGISAFNNVLIHKLIFFYKMYNVLYHVLHNMLHHNKKIIKYVVILVNIKQKMNNISVWIYVLQKI